MQARSEGQNARQGLAVCDREACVDLLLQYFAGRCPKCSARCCCVKDGNGKWYHRCVDAGLAECPCKNKRKQPDSRGTVDIASARRVHAARSATSPGDDDEEGDVSLGGGPGAYRPASSRGGTVPPSPAHSSAPTPLSTAAYGPPTLGGSFSLGSLASMPGASGGTTGGHKRRAMEPAFDPQAGTTVGVAAVAGGQTSSVAREVATLKEFVTSLAANIQHLTRHQEATEGGFRRVSAEVHHLTARMAALEVGGGGGSGGGMGASSHPAPSASAPAPPPADAEHARRVEAFNQQLGKVMSYAHGYFAARQQVDAALDDNVLATVPRSVLATMGAKLGTLQKRLQRLRAILVQSAGKFTGAFMSLDDLTRWEGLVYAESAWLEQVKTSHAGQTVQAARGGGLGQGNPGLLLQAPAPASGQRHMMPQLTAGGGLAAGMAKGHGDGGSSVGGGHPASTTGGRSASDTDLVGMASAAAPPSYHGDADDYDLGMGAVGGGDHPFSIDAPDPFSLGQGGGGGLPTASAGMSRGALVGEQSMWGGVSGGGVAVPRGSFGEDSLAGEPRAAAGGPTMARSRIMGSSDSLAFDLPEAPGLTHARSDSEDFSFAPFVAGGGGGGDGSAPHGTTSGNSGPAPNVAPPTRSHLH